MTNFDTSHVKNIVLLGHAGSGKTTLAECMLFEAEIINRRRSIEERNTVGDFYQLEQERGDSGAQSAARIPISGEHVRAGGELVADVGFHVMAGRQRPHHLDSR